MVIFGQATAMMFDGVLHQIDEIVARMVEITNPRALLAFENRIGALEEERLILLEKAIKSPGPAYGFMETFELSLRFLANPYRLWDTGHLIQQKMVLRLAFSGSFSYDRETGSLNTKKSIPFRVLEGICKSEKDMVPNGSNMLNTILAELDGWEEVLKDVNSEHYSEHPEP